MPSAAGVAVLALVVSGLVALYLPTGAAAAAAPPGILRADGGRIADGNGNTVLLRGVNVNQLVDFYQPRPGVPATEPLTEEDFAQIASYGFDVVRLGISWSALEPQRGVLDPAYLQRIDEAVRWAGAHRIYVVLDMHQDAWSKEPTPPGTNCRPGTDPMWGYDGAPAWATIADGTPRCQFTGRDISPAGDRAFQHFFQNTDGVRDALVRTWGELAGHFAGDPVIAGYDLLNEPGFGEQAPLTTSQRLGEYQAHAIRAIRDAGAQQIVFVEPSILWSGLGFDTGPYPGFTDDLNIVFSPHLYAESITMDASLGLPTIVSTERQFVLAQRIAAAYRAPLWSGEYGYWGSPEQIQHHIERYAAAEDAHALGSAYWVWKQACGDPQNGISDVSYALVPQDCATGGEAPRNTALLDVLSRAYPRSAPGRIEHLQATGATMSLTASGTGCGLDVWVPGDARPSITGHGIRQLDTVKVAGGWRIVGCTTGEYSLRTS
ncbi:hypothetical protein LK09_13520 [Microbacterium mangrovi]|uniref:Glycoside hydrolase family 5 domain-containing protein n=2 Tax=Microbacterium mangrovi TaxID=1348253 RepID=A0A0B2A1N0_9MICO|nr:hypothetical protein LK09_13520 [Microbacterium mangrovi]